MIFGRTAMVFLCSVAALRNTSIRSVSAFTSSSVSRSASTTINNSQLKASFLEEITKSFSSMTGGATGNNSKSKYYTVGITGASGLIGTAFQNELQQAGKTVNGKPVRVVTFRRGSEAETVDQESLSDDVFTSANSKSVTWSAASTAGAIDTTVLQSLDALVHLSGENISTGQGILAPLGIRPWTDSKKQEIIESRTTTTTALANAIAQSGNKKCDFLVASGVGVYGPDFVGAAGASTPAADESTDVSSTTGFLADVSRVWEASTAPAQKAGNRVVQMRNGVALSTKGGALAKLYPIFFLGGGGIVGGGDQYFPFVSNRDVARAMVHLLETPSLKGPVNMCAPEPATNADFTAAMGTVLKRPTLLPFPGFAVSLLFGEMGEEVLLGGTKATPKKLLDSGFAFLHPTVEDSVRSAVDEKEI
uniref:DUF1731 domain-containing protein n=1 Tax=Pseudo-nitzschia australis TaxID=44445 RepID=A0A7S4AUS9_9STRA